jgi:hypothetical protein
VSELSAFDLGQKSGSTFRESVETQLTAMMNKLGISTASLTTDSGTGSYGSGGRYTGGRSAGGRAGSRSIGGGHEFHAPDKPYRGEPVLGEDTPADTDAAKALRSGFKSAQEHEAGIRHGTGTEAEATPDSVRAAMEDPNRAAASAQAAGRRPEGGSASTDEAIQRAAKDSGIDVNTMRAIASIESSMDPGSNRNKKINTRVYIKSAERSGKSSARATFTTLKTTRQPLDECLLRTAKNSNAPWGATRPISNYI